MSKAAYNIQTRSSFDAPFNPLPKEDVLLEEEEKPPDILEDTDLEQLLYPEKDQIVQLPNPLLNTTDNLL